MKCNDFTGRLSRAGRLVVIRRRTRRAQRTSVETSTKSVATWQRRSDDVHTTHSGRRAVEIRPSAPSEPSVDDSFTASAAAAAAAAATWTELLKLTTTNNNRPVDRGQYNAVQVGPEMASIARDDPSPLPGMHRDHNALPSQTDGQTDTDIAHGAGLLI